jgi:hypothetical protein
MKGFDFTIIIRFFLFLMVISGFWFGCYLIIRAYKKTLERIAYFFGFIFVSISAIFLLLIMVPVF